MERTHQADELSENDTSRSLSEQVSDHDTPGEMSERDDLACHEIRDILGSHAFSPLEGPEVPTMPISGDLVPFLGQGGHGRDGGGASSAERHDLDGCSPRGDE